MTDTPNDEQGDDRMRRPDWFGAAKAENTPTTDETGFSPDDADWFDDIEPRDADIGLADDDSDPTEHFPGITVDDGESGGATNADEDEACAGTADATAEPSDTTAETPDRSDADLGASETTTEPPDDAEETETGPLESTPESTSEVDESSNRKQSDDATPGQVDWIDSGTLTAGEAVTANESGTDRGTETATSRLGRFLAWVRSVVPSGAD